jgi:NhaP-type Na+/H+ or K+/H+ antiporter
VDFILEAEEGEKLRVVGGFGLLYFLYPVIGGIVSGVLVVVYRWALRRFLKRT